MVRAHPAPRTGLARLAGRFLPKRRRSASLAVAAAALILAGAAAYSQTAAPAFDSGRAWEHLREVVALGPRPAGSAALEATRKYITAQLTAAGVTVAEQAWDAETPFGKVRMVNLIATIPGPRADRIIIS